MLSFLLNPQIRQYYYCSYYVTMFIYIFLHVYQLIIPSYFSDFPSAIIFPPPERKVKGHFQGNIDTIPSFRSKAANSWYGTFLQIIKRCFLHCGDRALCCGRVQRGEQHIASLQKCLQWRSVGHNFFQFLYNLNVFILPSLLETQFS